MTEPADTIEGLDAQETLAIAALMSSPTIAQAAARVGIHERTLRRWLAEREPFRRALRREQRAVMAACTARLQQSAAKAIDTLEEVMEDGEAPHASKVAAARALLDLAHERIDVADLTERIEAIEGAGKPGRTGGWS
jgi:hypothetical protein